LLEIDAIHTARAPTLSFGRRGRSLITASAVAGISYATAWVVGLDGVKMFALAALALAWTSRSGAPA
jgi:hypothetical protein